MPIIIVSAILLISLTTVIHYEVLRILNDRLHDLPIPNRSKVLVVIFTCIGAHLFEILLYAFAFYFLILQGNVGQLNSAEPLSMVFCFHLSAETFTSLGFGDVVPVGPIRILPGIETLNGLLLIGWSASYTYIAMEEFWAMHPNSKRNGKRNDKQNNKRSSKHNNKPDHQDHTL